MNKGASIRDPKQRGEWAEICFMLRAAEEGFRVTKPWGDSARYDFAVESNGRFLRVQVKSSIARTPFGYRCWIQPARASGPYTAEQVDFFACYVIPKDLWYILPAEIALRLRGTIVLAPHGQGKKYMQYREAWHLLRESGAGKKVETEFSEQPAAADAACAADQEPAAPADPEAEPGEIPAIRGTVEERPGVGYDPDLVRRRLTACFERTLKQR